MQQCNTCWNASFFTTLRNMQAVTGHCMFSYVAGLLGTDFRQLVLFPRLPGLGWSADRAGLKDSTPCFPLACETAEEARGWMQKMRT